MMMFSRVVYPLLGIAYWQKAYETKHEREQDTSSDSESLNLDFISATETYVKVTIYVLIVPGIVLDIVAWK